MIAKRRLFTLLLMLSLYGSAFGESLLIAAGAGYKRPVAELAEAYEKKTGNKVEQIYGHMAGVVTQARQSGKVALIFGDLSYLEKVEGLSFSAFLPVGNGKLVVGWPTGKTLKSALDLADPRFARIAIPDPKAAIYGIAAMEFVRSANIEAAVKDRLQIVSTVPQVSAYLITGEIDAGLFNLTEALAIKDKIGGYVDVDQKYYSPIRIVAGVVKGFEDQGAVKALNDFLKTNEARSVLAKYGL